MDYSMIEKFYEDSLFVYKLADDGFDGYTTAFFQMANGDIVYKTASNDDTLKQIPNLDGFKIFPIKRTEFILITNLENEAIGYVKQFRISFSNRNHIIEFNSDLRKVRFKY